VKKGCTFAFYESVCPLAISYWGTIVYGNDRSNWKWHMGYCNCQNTTGRRGEED
jgi:hypothetical protein